MGDAKQIRVALVSAKDARSVMQRWHYSRTAVTSSQVHFGVFLGDTLLGAMSFGSPLDKRKVIGLVEGTPWGGMMELNRMAFSDRLPRNSESRALGVAFRMLRKHAPGVQWVISFADGAQCGDGTIYRAAGFVLTKINPNATLWVSPTGQVLSDLTLKQMRGSDVAKLTGGTVKTDGAMTMRKWSDAGWHPLPGFQLRYLYFLDPTARERLTVPVLPFSKIQEMGAGMYKGQART